MSTAAPSLDSPAHRDTLDLARRLIARRSLTPDDAGSLELIASRLQAAGFRCEAVDRGKVRNLWARHGNDRPVICLAGHVDVVPTGPVDQWTTDPFGAAEREGYLYGRGAADMKTSVAAMVTAAERWAAAAQGARGSVAMLLTSDEEGDAVDGTAAVVDALRGRGEAIDACIVGEPTSSAQLGDTIKNGRRGSLGGVMRITGVQCHIAYPERGRNPIHAALPALTELAAAVWDSGDEFFPPTSFQFSNVHAGAGAPNVIPGLLEARFNLRFSPASTPESIKARLHAVLDRHGIDYEITWSAPALPFITPEGGLVAALGAAIASVTGLTPALSTSGGTSDGRFLATIAPEVVEFGPLGESIHGIDERVRIADIGPLSTIYELTITALLRDLA
jgi:succinyl-diaminopimelate desuccinylase